MLKYLMGAPVGCTSSRAGAGFGNRCYSTKRLTNAERDLILYLLIYMILLLVIV